MCGVFCQPTALSSGAQHQVCLVLRRGFSSKAGCWRGCWEKSLLPFLSLQNLTRMRQLRKMGNWEWQLSPGRWPLPSAHCLSTMAVHPTASPKVCRNNFCPSPLPFYPASHCSAGDCKQDCGFFCCPFLSRMSWVERGGIKYLSLGCVSSNFPSLFSPSWGKIRKLFSVLLEIVFE